MSKPPTYYYPMTSNLRFFLHFITKTKNGLFKEPNFNELTLCDLTQELLVTRKPKNAESFSYVILSDGFLEQSA
jgi:hypothetical protein